MKGHGCGWRGCGKVIPLDYYMCREHWTTLPQEIRANIWREYEPGQSVATMSDAYRKAIVRAQSWIIATFGASSDDHDPHLWARLVLMVRKRDAARARRREAT